MRFRSASFFLYHLADLKSAVRSNAQIFNKRLIEIFSTQMQIDPNVASGVKIIAILTKFSNFTFKECVDGKFLVSSNMKADHMFEELSLLHQDYSNSHMLRDYFITGHLPPFFSRNHAIHAPFEGKNCWEFILHATTSGRVRFLAKELFHLCTCAVLAYGIDSGFQRLVCLLNYAFDGCCKSPQQTSIITNDDEIFLVLLPLVRVLLQHDNEQPGLFWQHVNSDVKKSVDVFLKTC